MTGKKRLRIAWLPDGKRLHLQDGAIDIILQGFGRPGDIARAYDAAIARARTLVDELRDEVAPQFTPIGDVASRMRDAVLPFRAGNFVSPMVGFGGAVADTILATMLGAASLDRAFVNNGRDIALHLAPGQSFNSLTLDRQNQPRIAGRLFIEAVSKTRGLATAGWRGLVYSLGIADAVTVTSISAAAADAAAAIIADATDLPGHHAVLRTPVSKLSTDSRLGDILVTTGVGDLTCGEQAEAVAAGAAVAEALCAAGLITGAALYVKDEMRVVRAEPHSSELMLS